MLTTAAKVYPALDVVPNGAWSSAGSAEGGGNRAPWQSPSPTLGALSRIAALYIDPRGPYPKMAGVDCWDLERDARLYDGPYPVVAHPPCGPWGRLKHLYQGSEHDCAPRAVEQVRAFGGVLEHPAHSKLWSACDLPRPGEFIDAWGGWSMHVDQCAYGHVARKSTWLYCVGINRRVELSVLRGGTPTHWIGRFRYSEGRESKTYRTTGSAVPPGIKVCSTQQRRRTPPAFAEWLVELARTVALNRAEVA